MIQNREVGIGNSLTRSRIFGLDLMRSLAIALVVIGHASWIFPKHALASPILALMSYFGVEIFFVLSGFLIGGILYREFTTANFDHKSISRFLKRRWFRTFPNYFLILVVNIIIAGYIGYEIEDLWRYFFFLQNFANPMLPFFPESWSLSVEEFAYLLLPFVLYLTKFLFARVSRRLLFVIAILVLVFVFIATKVFYHCQMQSSDMAVWNLGLKSVVIYRLDAIFIGALTSWIYAAHRHLWRSIRPFATTIGLIMCAFFTVGVGFLQLTIDTAPFFWNVMYLPLTSLTVACFLPYLSEWDKAPIVFSKPVTFLSRISYSVYLLHYGVVLQLMMHLLPPDDFTLGSRCVFAMVYVCITIVLSTGLYHLYEKPLLQWGKLSS